MSNFIDELKRRSVVRVALAYVVVSWLILQVSDIFLDFVGAPEWVGKAIVALLALGLIPADAQFSRRSVGRRAGRGIRALSA